VNLIQHLYFKAVRRFRVVRRLDGVVGGVTTLPWRLKVMALRYAANSEEPLYHGLSREEQERLMRTVLESENGVTLRQAQDLSGFSVRELQRRAIADFIARHWDRKENDAEYMRVGRGSLSDDEEQEVPIVRPKSSPQRGQACGMFESFRGVSSHKVLPDKEDEE
jgi:hypothetical protein